MSQIFHLKEADTIEMIATAAVSVDDFIDVGGNLGVALADAAIGEAVSVRLTGVIHAPKGAEALTFGATVTANPAPTNTVAAVGGSITGGGVVVADAASGDATVLVRLPG